MRRVFALVLGVSLLGGCASHSDKTKEIRSALDAGQPRQALELINEQLEVDSEKQLPENTGGDNALFLLDRAMVLQQLQSYKLSSRDLEVCDKQIEMLDFKRNTADDIGKYLFSDDVGPYKGPPYEKLMINTMNMVNYLVQGDLQGARVEARRLAVMQKYLKDTDPDNALLAPGSYLAGFTFEKSGSYDEALRYYDEALQYGQYQSLAEPVKRLMARSGYATPRLRKLAGLADGEKLPQPEVGAPESEPGELLVIVSYGRVPAKVARRLPIGLALTWASGSLEPGASARAQALGAQGLVTWVNYPELGRAVGKYDSPWFRIDGKQMPLEGIVAVDQEAKKAWDEAKGTVIASAITRMIARVAAGEGVRRAAGDDHAIAGFLLSLATQATLTATDTPDTRSWATLPARMAFARVRLPAGARTVQLYSRGKLQEKKVTIKPGGFAVVNLTTLE
ncbi:MAG TPA: hypothetical protein VEX18_19955 [Polyangiaceae bacterium]|nr:hypothetical protein [Polyangiaceae bacterium]